MGSDMHSVPKLPIRYAALWQILQAHLRVTDLELMDQNSDNRKSKSSHLPPIVFGHADTFGYMCQVFDILALKNLPRPQYGGERQ